MESVEERIHQKDKDLRAVVASAKRSLENAIHEVQRISQNLRPSELDDLGVVSAVRSMCDEFTAATKIDVDLKFSRFPKNLSPEVEVTVYRIIQEALSNVAKHSEATRLTIRCAKEHSQLALQIKDNGKGTEHSDLGVRSGTGIRHGIVEYEGKSSLCRGECLNSILAEERDGDHRAAAVRGTRRQGDRAMKKSKIKILIVDDHPLVREGLRSCLIEERNLEIMAKPATARRRFVCEEHPSRYHPAGYQHAGNERPGDRADLD